MQHVREVTAKTYCKRLRIFSRLGDLDDAERMKTPIRTRSVSEAVKELYTQAYDYYVRYKGFSWTKARFAIGQTVFPALGKRVGLLSDETSKYTRQLISQTYAALHLVWVRIYMSQTTVKKVGLWIVLCVV